MNTKYLALAVVVIAIAIVASLLLYPEKMARGKALPTHLFPALTHQQEVWRSALEWCESQGKPGAINPKDRDGTASLGGWQFKTSTFKTLSERYGVVATSTMDYEAQKEIVGWMILDSDISNQEFRNQQFPDCIQRVVGLPPRTNATTSPSDV